MNFLYKNFANQYAYRFVSYNEYEGLTKKTAKFSELIYDIEQSEKKSNFCFRIENTPIRLIPIDALKKLKVFLDNKRNSESDIFEKPTFCNTIYTVVVKELQKYEEQEQEYEEQEHEHEEQNN